MAIKSPQTLRKLRKRNQVPENSASPAAKVFVDTEVRNSVFGMQDASPRKLRKPSANGG